MKPHITNHEHQKFIFLLEDNLHKMEEIPNEQKMLVAQKIKDLKSNRHSLEEIYTNYQLKLKELTRLLDDYVKTKQTSRINLRKNQLWLKFTYSKINKEFF